MKIKFLRQYPLRTRWASQTVEFAKPGSVHDLPDRLAATLVTQGVAEFFTDEQSPVGNYGPFLSEKEVFDALTADEMGFNKAELRDRLDALGVYAPASAKKIELRLLLARTKLEGHPGGGA